MKLIFIIILLFIIKPAFATGQAPDKIFYEGKERSLFANPLEAYYETGRKRPSFMIGRNTMSSGNWRGYVATWIIQDDRLYLQEIDSWVNGRKATLQKLFGKRVQKGKVNALWFSGELRIPDGKQLQYAHMGYGSVYERDIILIIEKGQVISKKVIDNTQGKLPPEFELQRQELEKLKKKDKPANSLIN